jgi:hypothetical protein
MDASKCKVLKLLQPTVLPRNDVVNLERRRVKCRRQLAILTAILGSLPNTSNESRVQSDWLAGRTLQCAPSLGLDYGEEIADMKITIKFGLLIDLQFALTSQLRQLIHASGIVIGEADRQQVFRRATG